MSNLTDDLRRLGLPEGAAVIAHVSTRAIGEGGETALLEAVREVIGAEGTVVVPAFTPQFIDPAEVEGAPESAEEIERARDHIGVFDLHSTPADEIAVGPFAEMVRRQGGAVRSNHPVYSFAAIGPLAERLMANAPFHYPFGTDGPLARLHSHDGWILLVGLGQQDNSALHLAEIWANVPYVHIGSRVKARDGRWTEMLGAPGCTDGFPRIESVLNQSRILRRGTVGGAHASLMRMREAVSMAIAMMQGAADALLCGDPECPRCGLARKATAKSTYIEGQSV